jgi:hypothetical protein
MSDGYFNFSAAFRVRGAGPRHMELSERLSLKPTSTVLRGEPTGALGRPAKDDMWILESPLPEDCPLHEHLRWLEGRLASCTGFVQQLMSEGVYVDIFVGYRTDHDASDFNVPPKAFAFVNDLGVPLHVSFIVA